MAANHQTESAGAERRETFPNCCKIAGSASCKCAVINAGTRTRTGRHRLQRLAPPKQRARPRYRLKNVQEGVPPEHLYQFDGYFSDDLCVDGGCLVGAACAWPGCTSTLSCWSSLRRGTRVCMQRHTRYFRGLAAALLPLDLHYHCLPSVRTDACMWASGCFLRLRGSPLRFFWHCEMLPRPRRSDECARVASSNDSVQRAALIV